MFTVFAPPNLCLRRGDHGLRGLEGEAVLRAAREVGGDGREAQRRGHALRTLRLGDSVGSRQGSECG